MALLAGTEVRTLFVGVGPRLGFSFVPNAVGVLSGIAILALFLFLLRVWPRQVPKMQPAARLTPNPSIAQIVSEVRDHKERVAAAIRDEADADVARRGQRLELGQCRPVRQKPAWTVLYNLPPASTSRWVGTAWEFFDDEPSAKRRYEELASSGHYPTKRPYHEADRPHLGAVHATRNEG